MLSKVKVCKLYTRGRNKIASTWIIVVKVPVVFAVVMADVSIGVVSISVVVKRADVAFDTKTSNWSYIPDVTGVATLQACKSRYANCITIGKSNV